MNVAALRGRLADRNLARGTHQGQWQSPHKQAGHTTVLTDHRDRRNLLQCRSHPHTTSNDHPECCSAAHQSCHSSRLQSLGVNELTVCGLCGLSLRWLPMSAVVSIEVCTSQDS